jgi:hypothetical protein
MADERILLNCIVPISEMNFRCSVEVTEKILRDVLRVSFKQLSCFIPQFSSMIKQEVDSHNENFSYSRSAQIIPCEVLFDLIEEPKFWRCLRNVRDE